MNGETRDDGRKAAYWAEKRARQARPQRPPLPAWLISFLLGAPAEKNSRKVRSFPGGGRRGPIEDRDYRYAKCSHRP